MTVISAHRYWSREDAPGRAVLLQALAQLQPGQRLRLADVIKARGTEEPGSQAPGTEARADEELPLLADYTSTAIRGARIDPETREVELSFSSEEPYERWWGVEILGHDRGEVDMGWIASGRAPFLSSHYRDQQIGIVTRAWLDATTRRARAVVRYGRSDLAEQEMRDSQDDVRVNVSVGYEILELELVKKDEERSTYRVTQWRPLEVSLVSIPADMTVGLGRSVSAETPAPAAAAPRASLPAQPRSERNMSTQAPEAPATGDAAFRDNVQKINKLARAYEKWVKPSDVAEIVEQGADPQRMNDLIMQRMQTGAVDTAGLAGIGATQREAQSYSFLRAIQAQMPGANVDAGFEREVSAAIAKAMGREAEGIFVPVDVMLADLYGRRDGEKRDFLAGTPTQAGNLINTTVSAAMWTDVLRPALAFAQLGVTILPGLTGNVGIPRKTVAGTLAMLTEVAQASETEPTTALPVLSPKRVASFVEPSKQAIIQSVIGIESMLRQDLIDGCAVLMENQGINGNGTSPNARGIRNVSGVGSVVGGTNGGNLSWPLIVALETAAANANAISGSRAGYLINTKTRGSAKTTQRGTNLAFCWDNGDTPLNGYRAAVTNNVPGNLVKGSSGANCSSAIFSADWSMFVMGLFGGIDVTVDPYTLAREGQVRITLNQFFDFQCRQPGVFSVIDDLLTP